MTECPPEEQALIDELRNIPDVLFPVGQRNLMEIVENQQLIGRGIAKLIEVLPDHTGRGFGNPGYDV